MRSLVAVNLWFMFCFSFFFGEVVVILCCLLLVQKMLKYDPAERISAKSALDHPYFDSLDKSQFWSIRLLLERSFICCSNQLAMQVFGNWRPFWDVIVLVIWSVFYIASTIASRGFSESYTGLPSCWSSDNHIKVG